MEFRTDEATGRFEAWDDGTLVGWVAYRTAGGAVELTHTEVPPAYAGRGIAGAVAAYALGYIAERHLKVIPACSYIQGYLTKHPELQGLVQAGPR